MQQQRFDLLFFLFSRIDTNRYYILAKHIFIYILYTNTDLYFLLFSNNSFPCSIHFFEAINLFAVVFHCGCCPGTRPPAEDVTSLMFLCPGTRRLCSCGGHTVGVSGGKFMVTSHRGWDGIDVLFFFFSHEKW